MSNLITQNNSSSLSLFVSQADQAAEDHVFSDFVTRKSKNTQRTHAAAIKLFASFIADYTGDPAPLLHQRPDAWAWVSFGVVQAFVLNLLNQGYAINSINQRLSTIKTYAGLAHQTGHIDTAGYMRIKAVSGFTRREGRERDRQRPKTRIGHKKATTTEITADQAKAFKTLPDEYTAVQARDCLLFCLLLELGLRVSEVAILQLSAVDMDKGLIRLYRPKVDKTQTHQLHRLTILAMNAYLPERDHLNEPGLILASHNGGVLVNRAMSINGIFKRVRSLGEGVGLSTLSPHDCRHSWATAASAGNTTLKVLKDAGGWSSLVMPERYTRSAEIANEGVVLAY